MPRNFRAVCQFGWQSFGNLEFGELKTDCREYISGKLITLLAQGHNSRSVGAKISYLRPLTKVPQQPLMLQGYGLSFRYTFGPFKMRRTVERDTPVR